jgi:hypothetical protein
LVTGSFFAAPIRRRLGAVRQLHPLAGALFDRGDECGQGDDDIAAEREGASSIMVAIPTITLKIEADLLTQTRFRWLLCEGDQVLLRCQHSFETMGEAEADGNKALEKRIKVLRAPPSPEWPGSA